MNGDIQEPAGSFQMATGLQLDAKAAIHSMKEIFDDKQTDSVILVDASNAFNSLNRNAALHNTGLSMNILHAGNKSPMQRGFFTNSVGDLLPTLGFLGGLFNFCNFIMTFSLM